MKKKQISLIKSKNNTNKLDLNRPLIFSKKLNNKSKVIPLNILYNKVGPRKHYTPAAQEWFNNIYAYNKNYIKLLPVADKNLMNLVKSYFNLYIKKYISSEINEPKLLRTRYKRLSAKKIFVGKGDIKHTSTKVIITLYVYNYEKIQFLAKEAEDIKDWFTKRRSLNIQGSLVRKVLNSNVLLSYKNWFSWNSYSLLHRNKEYILEQFYFKKFFKKLYLKEEKNMGSLNSIYENTNNNLIFYLPLYNDYIKFKSSLNLKENIDLSFNNFINIVRLVSLKSIKDLKNNNVDIKNKVLYLKEVKNYLSQIFLIKDLSKIIFNFEKLKDLKDPLAWNFDFRNLKRRFLIFKYKTYSYDYVLTRHTKRFFTLSKYIDLISNISIKNVLDLNKKDLDLKDITLYLNYVNKYLNKNLDLVHSNFISNIIANLLNNNKNNNSNTGDNTIYIDYYRYLSNGDFVYGNNPTFDEFFTTLDNFTIEDLKSLKDKYEFYSTIAHLKAKGKKRMIWLSNLRKYRFYKKTDIFFRFDKKDFIKYSVNDMCKQAIKFKENTIKNYFKSRYISLHKLIFNQNKFTNSFMKCLIDLTSKLYNKKIIFNIVNLGGLHLNSDIYTQAVTLKLKNRKNKLFRVLKQSLSGVKIPYVKRVTEKHINQNLNELLENKVKNIKINSMLVNYITNKDPFNKLLLNFYSKNHQISEPFFEDANLEFPAKSEYTMDDYLILENLKHRNLAGVRIEAKGRLTRRLTASRSVFKVKWIGGLKNVDSSFKKLSTIMLRGHAKSNVLYSNYNSKNRNGTFGIKGWVSSK